MRYLKKFVLICFVASCLILSFFVSASAVDDPVNFVVDEGVNPFNRQNVDTSEVSVFSFITKSSNGFGYWIEYYIPKFDSSKWNTYYYFSTNCYEVYVGCETSSTYPSSVSYYVYDTSGNVVTSGTNTLSFASSKFLPRRVYTVTPSVPSTYLSGNCVMIHNPFYSLLPTTVEYRYSWTGNTQGYSIARGTPTGFAFTLNGKSVETDDDGNIVIPGDDSGGSGCNCINYTQLLETIITNQDNQLIRLNTIISILQNSNNDDVVAAVNSASDRVINSNPGYNPPSKINSDDYTDPEEDLLDNLPGINDSDVNSINSHLSSDSLNSSAIQWWYARISDITSNGKFRAVMLTMLSISLIAFILNKRGVL